MRAHNPGTLIDPRIVRPVAQPREIFKHAHVYHVPSIAAVHLYAFLSHRHDLLDKLLFRTHLSVQVQTVPRT